MHYLSFGVRLWLALVCVVAVIGKTRGRRSFGDFVTSLELAARAVPLVRSPASFARLVAPPILLAEAATAVLLPLPAPVPAMAGAALAVLLFGVFTVGVTIAVVTGVGAPCACFGRISRTLSRSDVVRDAVLLVGAGVALVAGTGPVAPAGGVAAAVAAVVATLLVVFWSDIAVLAGTPGVAEAEVSQ